MSEEEDCPVSNCSVSNEVCKARMEAHMAWIKATFTSTVVTIALIIIQLARGH